MPRETYAVIGNNAYPLGDLQARLDRYDTLRWQAGRRSLTPAEIAEYRDVSAYCPDPHQAEMFTDRVSEVQGGPGI